MDKISGRPYTFEDLKDELEQLVVLAADCRNTPSNPIRAVVRFQGYKKRALEILDTLKLPPRKEVTVKAMIEALLPSFSPDVLESRIASIIDVINNRGVEILDFREIDEVRAATMEAMGRITAK